MQGESWIVDKAELARHVPSAQYFQEANGICNLQALAQAALSPQH